MSQLIHGAWNLFAVLGASATAVILIILYFTFIAPKIRELQDILLCFRITRRNYRPEAVSPPPTPSIPTTASDAEIVDNWLSHIQLTASEVTNPINRLTGTRLDRLSTHDGEDGSSFQRN